MSNVRIETIVSIEELDPIDDWVYDIEMEETYRPYFFGNGILVHNSTYFATHAETDEEAIVIADAVADVVDASFPEFMRTAFMCTTGYDTIMGTSRELVCDTGIFVDKKRYVMHVINEDGIPVDKLKIMGLELKKTTLPREVQKQLTTYIGRLLGGEEWAHIAPDVVQYKEELIQTDDILSIGLPMGVHGLEQYTLEYARNKKCRIPGHVSACIFYNQQRMMAGDNISLEITSGMKIKVLYMKVAVGRFKAIAIPTDIECLPEWFNREYLPLIHRGAQMYRLVDRPLQNILHAMGEQAPTKQTLHVLELFTF